MITLKLTGALAERFGTEFHFDVNTPSEAVRALCMLKDDLTAIVRMNDFNMWVDDTNIDERGVHCEYGTCVVTLGLHISGSGGGNGIWAIIAGIAIIVVAWWNPAGWGAAAQMMAYGLGAGLAASGAAQLLMPTPNVANTDEEGNRASYGFNRPATTTDQGNIVPVAYGKCLIGGFVISYRITTEDLAL